MVVGKQGNKLKEIGIRARSELERRFGNKVFLELFVKTKPNWTQDENLFREYG